MIRLGFRVGLMILLMGFSAPGQPAIQRTANSSLHMPLVPPIQGYTITNTLTGVTLSTPYAVASPPGETNRLFIVEKAGRVVVITNLANPTRTVFLDITDRVYADANEEGLFSIAFHPGYATNRYFYVAFTGPATTTNLDSSLSFGRHDCISRFQASAGNSNQAMGNTELPMIRQYDRDANHNSGDLHFGPDGYLYASLGDEGSGYDSFGNAQSIDHNFFSGIIRIDVDKRATNRAPNPHPSSLGNYYVPQDNPFVGATSFNGITVNSNNVRNEFWCVGLRNPWRFTFDPTNGRLYCGDVGQEDWEEINLITKGGNYGWAYREGNHNGPKSDIAPPGFTGSIGPILEYPHGTAGYEGRAVIGGVVYAGNRIPQLTGAYVFGDYISGNIWSMRYNGSVVTEWQRICYEAPTSFGVDPSNGDVLLVKHTENAIKRLIYVTNSVGTPIPLTLDQTGAFTDLQTLQPNPGIVPFDVNAPFWSDNAKKTRWFSVPNTNLTITFNAEGNWSFPTGTVWIKHFDLEMTNGVPSSAKRIETRFLVQSSNGVYGVTYRWGGSLTNATLVADGGMDEDFTIYENGSPRTQTWHYPSRFECQICHNSVSGWALGFNTHQLNRDFNDGSVTTNQIRALHSAGYFSAPITNFVSLRALVNPTNTSYSLDYRAHSYLTANCVHCHQPGGAAVGYWDARIYTPLSGAGIIDGQLNNAFGYQDYRVIAPGSPNSSVLLNRISTLGNIRMPPLASHLVNTQMVNLIYNWAVSLTNYETFPQWQVRYFGSTNAAQASPDADPDNDKANNYFEYLTGTSPLSSTNVWKAQAQKTATTAKIVFPQVANRGFEVQYTTNLVSQSWRSLDVPGNPAAFSASNLDGTISDQLTNTNRFYKVRVFEP